MCSECGAPDNDCEARFNDCIAREFEDPAYGRVHHLTVSAYMLQHSSKLTREGWLYERELLREFLLGGKPPEVIRKERSALVDGSQRTFKLKSRTGLPIIPRVRWTKTIVEVRTDDPQQYCEDVIAWASATLEDSELIEPIRPV